MATKVLNPATGKIGVYPQIRQRPRYLRGYPFKTVTGVQKTKRGAVKTNLIRQPRPRIHGRSKYRTKYDKAAYQEDRAEQDVRGSLEERIFYKALVGRGFIPGVDFDFQSSMMGGRQEFGGLVADFLFFVPKIIVNPLSHWHTLGFSLENVQRDLDQEAVLRSMGYLVLTLWPDTILDPIALDWWMDRNIMHLWGTSTQPLGLSGARSGTYLKIIFGDYPPELVDQLIGKVNTMIDVLVGVL